MNWQDYSTTELVETIIQIRQDIETIATSDLPPEARRRAEKITLPGLRKMLWDALDEQNRREAEKPTVVERVYAWRTKNRVERLERQRATWMQSLQQAQELIDEGVELKDLPVNYWTLRNRAQRLGVPVPARKFIAEARVE